MSVIWTNSIDPFITKDIKIPYPYFNKGLKYTGNEVSPTWINYNSEQITISGTLSAVEKGAYTTTFTPKEGFCWVNGDINGYEIEWRVFEDVISYPEQAETLTYNENTLVPTWTSYDSNIMSLSGTMSAINAGTYNCVFTLNDGYGWIDGSVLPYSATWEIEKREGIKSFSPKTMTISLSGTNRGFFNIYFYEETFPFSAWKSDGFNPTGIADGGLFATNTGTLEYTFEIEGLAIGTTTFTYTTKETANHKSATATCVITVTA